MAAEFMEAEEVVKTAKPADLIEIKRDFGIYKHWALYVGDGDIVNFGSDSITALFTHKKSRVEREKLTKVADSDLCRVNNRLDDTYPPRDPNLVVSDALRLVGKKEPYSVATWNCEHFVTGLRYYKPESGQVEHITYAGVAIGAILFFGAGLLLGKKLGESKEEEEEKKEEKEQEQQKV